MTQISLPAAVSVFPKLASLIVFPVTCVGLSSLFSESSIKLLNFDSTGQSAA